MRDSKAYLVALLAASVMAVPAVADAAIVLRSAGPSSKAYPPGKSVAESAQIQLQPGDAVTVLVSNSTRVLRGPGSFKLAGGAKTAAAAFNARGRFSSMRNGENPSSPSLWHVDVSQSGTFCVAPEMGVKLWLPPQDEPVTLTIASPTGAVEKIEGAGGQEDLVWSAGAAVADGAEYRVSWTGNEDPSRLKFARLASLPNDPQALASAFIEKGCQSQLDMFIDTTKEAS